MTEQKPIGPDMSDPDRAKAYNIAFARERGFGAIGVNAGGSPIMKMTSYVISEDDAWLQFHVPRRHPIAQAMTEPRPARLIVSGPDGYVSPDWSDVPEVLPTWNFVSVQMGGTLEERPKEELEALINAEAKLFEEWLTPKPRWSTAKLSAEALEKIMNARMVLAMRIETVNAMWKLHQEMPEEVRNNIADHIEAFGYGRDLPFLVALMRGAGDNMR